MAEAGQPADGGRPQRRARLNAPLRHYGRERDLPCGPSGRPDSAERRRANEVIDLLHELNLLARKAAVVTSNAIALALAYRSNDAEVSALSQVAANELFGLERRHHTRRDWVEDELRRLDEVERYEACDAAGRAAFRACVPTATERAAARAQRRLQGGPLLSLERFAASIIGGAAKRTTARSPSPSVYHGRAFSSDSMLNMAQYVSLLVRQHDERDDEPNAFNTPPASPLAAEDSGLEELINSSAVTKLIATTRKRMKRARKKERRRRALDRAHQLYKTAERKRALTPAPHGYGDGYFECACKRCDRSARYEAAAEVARVAWERAVALWKLRYERRSPH